MSIEVTVLGSSGSFASPHNPCTGYLVRTSEAAVLLDCGPGTLGPLQEALDLRDLTAIVITHCHPDHWLELPVMRNVFTYFLPRAALPVYGTAETAAMNDAVTVGVRPSPFEWSTIDPTTELTIGDQYWRFARTDHPVETLAVRVDADANSFVYTSDTGPGWSLGSLGTDIDLAMCDASHLQDLEGRGIPHMSARQAGAAAREAGVARLVVTHLVPGSDPEAHRAEAAAAYGGSVDVALQGSVFTV